MSIPGESASPGEATPAQIERDVAARARVERTAFADGASMVWRLWGSGPPLMLLHGGYGSWRHFIRNIDPLSRDFTVVVPDMPGFGDSDPTDGMVTTDWMAETVARGLGEVLGAVTPYRVAGFSFGSVISSHMPGYSGGAMRALTVIAYNRLGLFELIRPPMKNWRKADTREELEEAQRFNLASLMFHDPANIDDLAVHLQIENTRRSRLRSIDVAKTHDLPGRLHSADIALCGLWGEHDVTLRTGMAEARAAFERLFPDAPAVVIEGAGHWVQYEAAGAFNQALRDLMASA